MTFLNPLVLFALAAAAIPLLIHLFNFRKPRKVDFSTLAFLQDLQQSTMRRVRVQQWLLLALRTLALACLVLAFARPTMRGAWAGLFGGRVATSMALVVDNSLSMTVRDAQGEYLGQAKDLAAQVLETMQPGDEVYLVPTVPPDAARPTAYSQSGPALDALGALTARSGATTLGETVARAAALLDDASNLHREVVVLTDLQAATFLDSAQVGLPDDIALTLLPLGSRPAATVAVTDVRVESRVVEAGQPVDLAVTLVNYGPDAVDAASASVFLDGQRVAQLTEDLEPNTRTTLRTPVAPPGRGWLHGEVRLEPDAFEPDDVRYFVLPVPETRRVLVVRGTGQRSDLVELALSLSRVQGGSDGRAFETRTIDEASLPQQDLNTVDVVVLIGPESLSSGEVASLAQFVRGGGGVLLFAGNAAGLADQTALLAALGGGQVAGSLGTPDSGRPVGTFDRVDLEHPLFAGIFGTAERPRLETAEVYAGAAYTPGPSEQALITLSSGTPFLTERRSDAGALLVLTTLPDPRWSDLAVRGLFVPLLFRSVFYLAADADDGQPPLQVGTPGTLRLNGVADRQPVRIVGPVEQPGVEPIDAIPAQRTLPGGLLLDIDAATLAAPGVYDLRQGETLLRRVAVNADAREFDLTRLDADDARDQLAAATGQDVRLLNAAEGRGLDAARLEADRVGVELWRFFLTLALLFLLAEMLVAMRWRQQPVATVST